ncbi:MAG TPA: hypothetical protein VJ385_06245 [Fibrobacteria bacterium]|nr:hypothetical protein [Fibrobacteria bacterium]
MRAILHFPSILWIAAACLPVTAQVRVFTPVPPDAASPSRVPWTAKPPLLLGASIYRPSDHPVRVWYRGEEAGWLGSLYLIDPVTHREIYLFDNTTSSTAKVDISRYIPVGATVHFKYVLRSERGSLDANRESWWPKYTGMDGPESPFYNRASSRNHLNPAMRYGNVWSASGMVNDSTMEFGFEDNAGDESDMDFDDVVFFAENLKVQAPKQVPRRSFLW